MQKPAAYKVQGMQRDASPVNFKPENAFEIVNMRLITDEEGSAFALVNEKGTKLACTLDDNTTWIPIGQCATTDSLIVFAVEKTVNTPPLNAIFKIQEVEDKWISSPLFKGDLSFSVDSPIETLFNYETEDIKKVYWIDGINPLRCINLAKESYSNNPTQFDSVLPFTDNQVAVDIERLSGGSFKAGVIQYYLTYFNKYRTESPIVWTSPLLYLANQERGAETDANVNTAFKFNISGLDSVNWEYVRLYSVFRSSIDTEPSANIVTEVKINNGTITAYDYGTSNTAIVASDLYFVGAKAVKAGTMTVKDQVLFLGNLKVDSKIEPELGDSPAYDLKTDTYKSRPFRISETEGTYYKYDNQLDNTESISTYKNGETYRFGYQLQDKWGNWSNPIFIEDKEIDFAPKMDYTDGEYLQLAQPSMDITALLEGFRNKGFIAARPLVVYPDVRDRKILCQGVVCPTVYNLKDRVDNSPYAQASWFMRPNIPGDIWGNKEVPSTGHLIDEEINPSYNGLLDKHLIGSDDGSADQFNLTRASILLDEVPNSQEVTDRFSESIDNKEIVTSGSWTEFRHNYALKTKGHSYGPSITEGIKGYPGLNKNDTDPDRVGVSGEYVAQAEKYYGLARGAEIDSTRGIATIPVNRFYGDNAETFNGTDIKKYNTGSSAYYVDSNIVTLNSPEIELIEDLYTVSTDNYKFRIVGMVPLTANISDISVETENPSLYTHEQPTNKPLGLNKLNIHTENVGYTGFRSLVAASPYLAWFHLKSKNDDGEIGNASAIGGNANIVAGHLLYPWQSTGNIQTFMSSDSRRTSYSKLKRKVLSNARFSAISYYLPEESWWTPSFEDSTSILSWTSTDNSIQKFKVNDTLNLQDVVYKGNIDSLAIQDVNGTSYDLYYYSGKTRFQGDNKDDIVDITEDTFYGPTFTINSDIVQKGMSVASSIKYKSSPHYAIFLGGKHSTKVNKTIVEVLPTLALSNRDYTYTLKHGEGAYMYNGQAWDGGIQYMWTAQVYDSTITIDTSKDQFVLSLTTEEIESTIEEGYILPWRGRVGINLHLYSDTYKYIKQALNTLGTFTVSKKFNKLDQATYQYLEPDTSEPISDLQYFNSFTITSIYREDENRSDIFIRLEPNSEVSGEEEYHYVNFSSCRVEVPKEDIRINSVGITESTFKAYAIARNNSLDFGRVYESRNVASLALQKGVYLGTTNLNLPDKYCPQPTTITANPINYGWLWLGEIYKDLPPTFGGDNEYALQNNKWEIAGNTVPLLDGATLEWSIGDTYYQRFDTLKTYAYADTDENSVIDITSFMVETRLNIDGRYDRNRGQENNLNMSPQNFNLFNKVYTQRNNFFTYSITPEDAAKRLSFPTQITWSLVKTPGENIDQWLNTTMSAILDLDGRKGELTSLETMGNEIIAFQEKGIANIIYNPRTQISAMDGTPIYIANSTKVEGFRYISDNVGSQDKWSIVSTPNGLYFVDLYNKGIYKFNGQLEDVSNAKGFHSWCTQNLNKDSKILGYYDFKNKDVYFINSEWDYPCLAYSEFTESFSSFYSYRNAKLAYLQGQGIWLSDRGNIYLHQEGEYNKFLDLEHYSDYHVTIICNQDGNLSKIFNNIEFRADSWEGNTAVADKSIDYLAIETEYQKKTEESLVFKKHGISNLKKKFNVWRANIPREQGTRNRFRDVWAKVTLGGRGNARKTRLNDIVVYYT